MSVCTVLELVELSSCNGLLVYVSFEVELEKVCVHTHT